MHAKVLSKGSDLYINLGQFPLGRNHLWCQKVLQCTELTSSVQCNVHFDCECRANEYRFVLINYEDVSFLLHK